MGAGRPVFAGVDAADAVGAIDLLEIEQWRAYPVALLPYGIQKRVELGRALAMEPREAQFLQLQGDLYALDKKHDRALASYQRSIRQNPNFFYGYLRKGQMEYQLNRYTASRGSLTQSLELMPTAEAHYLLGMMEKQQGNSAGAMEHFKTAAGSDSETGKKATNEYVMLDLESNPSDYIASRAVMDGNGQVWAQFLNRTGVPVREIEISYAWQDAQGQTRQSKKRFQGPLKGGEQDRVALGFSLNSPNEINSRVRVQVTAARIAR